MDRAAALDRLHTHADDIRAMGATSLYLYGSTARNEAMLASDIDLYVDYDPDGRFNAFDLVGIKLFLESKLGRHPAVALVAAGFYRWRARSAFDALVCHSDD